MPISDLATVEEWIECDKCGGILEIGRFPWCPHDFTAGHHPFKAYTVEHEGKTYTIDSIQAASHLERESMKKYRDGVGAPIALRAFHQDRSNLDVNTLSSLGYTQRPMREFRYDRRGNPRKVTKRDRE